MISFVYQCCFVRLVLFLIKFNLFKISFFHKEQMWRIPFRCCTTKEEKYWLFNTEDPHAAKCKEKFKREFDLLYP
jgi:hypothetical protein